MSDAQPARRPWFDLLSDDAQTTAAHLTTWLPTPFHTLGVERSRQLDFPVLPAGPPLQEVRDVQIPVDDGEITVRVYRPSEDVGLSVLVYLHGGGFFLGSLDGTDGLCRTLAKATGSVVVSVDYRLAPEHPFPTPALDCTAAVRWVHRHASDLGVEPRKMALLGDSAGGNLALSVALQLHAAGEPSPACLVLVYPLVEKDSTSASFREFADAPLIDADDVAWCWSLYLADDADAGDPRAVPNRAETLAFLPPTFVLTAEVDVLRDDAEDFAARLEAARVPTKLQRYQGVYHGFFTEVGVYKATDVAIHEVATFVRTHLDATPITASPWSAREARHASGSW